MKTSIIKALVITLAAAVKVAKACAKYHKCHCTMADGSTNDTITIQACDLYRKADGLDGTSAEAFTTVSENHVRLCFGGDGDDGRRVRRVDNCKMRDFCAEAGATGNDSSCDDKSWGLS
ncbi:hypothetical protein LZ31DRAFT_547947 [Colletotrichum somersetense]|nr:hypothetical protein LZ31DRAFT_547947 [Colletotrichum somersetense]